MRALVVDDEPAVRTSIDRALKLENYDVELLNNGTEAVARATDKTLPALDVILLDAAMPGLDGFATCRALRARGVNVPILMLTAKTRLTDKVLGLDSGADDYLTKPFDLDELYARLRSILRRGVPTTTESPSLLLTFDDLTLDPVAHRVTRAGHEITLTPTEFSLLQLLLEHPDEVLRRDWIVERVWSSSIEQGSNSLEVFMATLRRKVELDGRPKLLHTVRGIGYVARLR